MGTVNFILNLAGLLLWLNWRSNRFDPLVQRMPATLMGTLRPAAPKRLERWHLLALIAVLLLLRAVVYWWIGKEANWAGKLDLGVTVLWFSSGFHWTGLWHMILFSFYSFGAVLGIFYICLLPLSLLAGPMPVHGLVTIPLGRIDGWPRWARALLPLVTTSVTWWISSWLLEGLAVEPPTSAAVRFQQSAILGASSYLLWQFPIGVILVLHLLNSYIYFGKHSFWKYIDHTSRTLLRPLAGVPLRVGRIDLAPLVAVALLFLVAGLTLNGIKIKGYTAKDGVKMPEHVIVPGLIDIYGRLGS